MTSCIKASPRGWEGWIAGAALVAVLLPIAIAVINARVDGWIPVGDNAYFTVRSRDVLTTHHPLLGAWSSGSKQLDEPINNLGPLQLDLLAPFTKLFPYWGTALGSAVINAGAVIGVWAVARRLFGVGGVALVALATVGLQLTLGGPALVDPQQLALILPFWCLLWLCVALAAGLVLMLPWAALVASLLLQTHLSYAYQVATLATLASVALAIRARGRWRQEHVARWTAITVAVLAVCWMQTLWDQFFGTGNLVTALSQSDGGPGDVGLAHGARLMADAVLEPLFWLPGSMSRFDPRQTDISMWWSWSLIVVWFAAVVGVIVVGVRRRRPAVRAVGIIALGAAVSALLTMSSIPPTARLGLMARNYFWLWPSAMIMTVAVVAGLATVAAGIPAPHRFSAFGALTRAARTKTAPVLTAGAIVLAMTVWWSPRASWAHDTKGFESAFDIGDDLVTQLDARLDELDVEGPLMIDISRATGVNRYGYTILVELQRHGIEFTYEPASWSLMRFGQGRCEDGSASHELVLANGDGARRRPDDVVLASVDVRSPRQVGELARLERRFGRWLRRDVVQVDLTPEANLSALDERGMIRLDDLQRVLDHPGRPADDLASTMRVLNQLGRVEVPRHARGDFWRWRTLDRTVAAQRIAIYLSPAEPLEHDCDSTEPGDVRIDWPAGG